ncbi:MAG: hypothetical protein R3181_00025 [Rubricoccaceae bacterium]|nr:hypothetical protein [Rubricoccaceae bacterium]
MRPLTLALALLLAPAALAQPAVPELERLAWLVGTWVGSVDLGEDRQAHDVSTFSWAVGGHALRNVHAVGDGIYGGETLIWYDRDADAYPFVYVTTGGFTTQGLLEIDDDGRLVGIEQVDGDEGGMADGIDAVRSSSALDDDGHLVVSVAYQRDGQWGPEAARVYERDPDASLPCTLDPACPDE